MQPNNTPAQALAGYLLGRPVIDWITEQRTAGLSWRRIERALLAATNGEIDVTHEAIRGWAADAARAEDTKESA